MDLNIREMVETDWQRVSAIYKQGVETGIATFQNSIPEYKEWDESHLKTCRYVITHHQKVVGWAALSPVSSRCVYAGVAELSVYVDNDYKGQGLGSRLLTYLSDQTEKYGIWTLQAGIMQENKTSINLHKKCGFREVGYREKIGKDINGIWRNIVLMEKRSPLV